VRFVGCRILSVQSGDARSLTETILKRYGGRQRTRK
jgi:hypothetical protein